MAGGIPVCFLLSIISSSQSVVIYWGKLKWQVFVALDPPHWTLDPNKLLQSVTRRTKAIVLNRLVNSVEGKRKLSFGNKTCLLWEAIFQKSDYVCNQWKCLLKKIIINGNID